MSQERYENRNISYIKSYDDRAIFTFNRCLRTINGGPPALCTHLDLLNSCNLRSYAFVTLLLAYADMAIKHLNGKWVNEWTCLQVKKSNKKRDVKTAVVNRGREVCRAYRSGQCLETCPFGHKHTWR